MHAHTHTHAHYLQWKAIEEEPGQVKALCLRAAETLVRKMVGVDAQEHDLPLCNHLMSSLVIELVPKMLMMGMHTAPNVGKPAGQQQRRRQQPSLETSLEVKKVS